MFLYTACSEGDESEKAKLVSELLLQAYKDKKIRQLPPGLELPDDSSLDSPEDNLPLLEVQVR